MKIEYKYTQSNIFTASAAYLCHISFQAKRLQQKRFIRGRLMNIFLFTKQRFKVGLVIVWPDITAYFSCTSCSFFVD